MMAMRILVLAVVALTAGLAALWLGPDAKPRDHRWKVPAPLAPEISVPAAPIGLQSRGQLGSGAYLAILDRPLFAPDRRPPQPPDAKPEAPLIDPMADVRLLGIFSGNAVSGILISQGGKARRIRLNEGLGSWTLSEVKGREAVLVSGDQTRTLVLVPPKLPAATTSSAPAVPVPPMGSAAAPSGQDTVAQETQRREEARRENIRKRNELRATAGLPPVFD